MTEIKSEAASEKRKRGRPRLLSATEEKLVRSLCPDITTDRALHNQVYSSQASALRY